MVNLCKDAVRIRLRKGSARHTSTYTEDVKGLRKDAIVWSIAVAFVPYGDRTFFVPQHGGHE
jgi:hypothetical protein